MILGRNLRQAVYDGDFVADLPATQVEKGEFCKVPFLLGYNTDEGSSFIPGSHFDNITYYPTVTINTDAEFLSHVESLGVNSTVAQEIARLYPLNSPEQVLPLYTNNLPKELGIQYKRANTFWGDMEIIAPTKYAARKWTENGVT